MLKMCLIVILAAPLSAATIHLDLDPSEFTITSTSNGVPWAATTTTLTGTVDVDETTGLILGGLVHTAPATLVGSLGKIDFPGSDVDPSDLGSLLMHLGPLGLDDSLLAAWEPIDVSYIPNLFELPSLRSDDSSVWLDLPVDYTILLGDPLPIDVDFNVTGLISAHALTEPRMALLPLLGLLTCLYVGRCRA